MVMSYEVMSGHVKSYDAMSCDVLWYKYTKIKCQIFTYNYY